MVGLDGSGVVADDEPAGEVEAVPRSEGALEDELEELAVSGVDILTLSDRGKGMNVTRWWNEKRKEETTQRLQKVKFEDAKMHLLDLGLS